MEGGREGGRGGEGREGDGVREGGREGDAEESVSGGREGDAEESVRRRGGEGGNEDLLRVHEERFNGVGRESKALFILVVSNCQSQLSADVDS